MTFFTSTELVYARRPPPLGDLVGGFAEHWDISTADGAIAATVEESMSALGRAGRFLSNRFAYQQRHRLRIVDPAGGPLLLIVKPPPRLGLEYAEVRDADGVAAGTVRLIEGSGGLGFYDRGDARLGEARKNRRTHEMFAADGSPIGEFAGTATRGGYRFRVAGGLGDPLRSLVRAAPIVAHFLVR